MPYQDTYREEAAQRFEDAPPAGLCLLEFGTNWCGHCGRAQPAIAAVLREYPELPHVKVEDGPGRPLGRRFGVRLWPTLVLLEQGREVARVVRPVDAQALRAWLDAGLRGAGAGQAGGV